MVVCFDFIVKNKLEFFFGHFRWFYTHARTCVRAYLLCRYEYEYMNYVFFVIADNAHVDSEHEVKKHVM